jgi:hypothetical protein
MTDVAARMVGPVRAFGPYGVLLASHGRGDMRMNAPARGLRRLCGLGGSAGDQIGWPDPTESFAWPVVDFVGDPL